MAEEPSRPKLRLTERPPAPSPSPAAPPPTPERVFRAPALPVPEPPAVRLPPPPPPAPGPGRPTLRAAERPAPPPAVPPTERSSVAPLLGALACVVGAALLYTQVLRPRRAARDAASAPSAAVPGNVPPAGAAAAPVAPGPTADTPAVLERADPGASPEFRARVGALRLSGVFEGDPARAMIDGRLVRAGEVIDERLGLRFDGLEPGRRLRFRDAAGATVVRKY